MFPLQGLHAGQFIITDDPLALVSQLLSLLIQAIDITDFLIALLIEDTGQPIPDQMGLKIPLFLKDVRRDGGRWSRRFFVGSIHQQFLDASNG